MYTTVLCTEHVTWFMNVAHEYSSSNNISLSRNINVSQIYLKILEFLTLQLLAHFVLK